MEKKDVRDIRFVRKFSTCLFKNKRLPLGEMEFSKDFIHTDRGDKYPLLCAQGDFSERIENGEYVFSSENGSAIRLLGHLSPYAVYEAVIGELNGECGFAFVRGGEPTVIALKNEGGLLCAVLGEQTVNTGKAFKEGMRFSVLPRKNRFDVYVDFGSHPEHVVTFDVPSFGDCANETVFMNVEAGLYCSGRARVRGVSFFMDSGISQADIRPVRYENGETLTENGKVFLTASVRLEEGCYQGVFSWIPGTAEFALTGALFFDAGDGEWANDVASSLIFDRGSGKWIVWVCAFSHGHVLGRATFDGEPRYGKNVIDISLLPPIAEGADDSVFAGKKGDEDPDIRYDEASGKWLLAVCRISSEGGYRYHFFESSSPTDGFRFVARGLKGDETGGSFLSLGGPLFFICGNSFHDRSDYRVYEWGAFDRVGKLNADHPDGGFRGWGSVFTVRLGTREKICWLTFDRHNGSGWNWSYGNIYCFEGI